LVQVDEAAVVGNDDDDDHVDAGGRGVKDWACDNRARTETEAGIFMVVNWFPELRRVGKPGFLIDFSFGICEDLLSFFCGTFLILYLVRPL
jgi:hypothetical protein